MTKQVFQTTLRVVLIVETGQVAKQARNGSVVVRYGSQLSWLLLLCLRRARWGFFMKSTTKRKCMRLGSFLVAMKQEGRPSTDATLTARLIDRLIRQCLRKVSVTECKSSTQSFLDRREMHLPMAAMFGSSLALYPQIFRLADNRWELQVGYVDNEIIINPTQTSRNVHWLTVKSDASKHISTW